jgi:hypothetical protein
VDCLYLACTSGRSVERLSERIQEGAGLYAIAHGFALLHGTEDYRKIELETPMYDALYAWCQNETA